MVVKFLRFLLVIFVMFNVNLIISQGNALPLNKLNKKDQKIGQWKVFYENSNQLRYVGQFDNDVPVGDFTYYYPTGELSAKMEYVNDSVAYVIHYHDNGNVMGSGKFLDKQKDSTWKLYNRQGQLILKSFYEIGISNGLQQVFYPTDRSQGPSSVMEKYFMIDGLIEGKWQQFFKDGSIKSKGNFSEGSKSGDFVYYLEDGTIDARGSYVNNLKHGKWYYYAGENNNASEINYFEGEPIDEDDLINTNEE
jgi:antitoxin component YwqK of YwqJK toxin-antitoxin module